MYDEATTLPSNGFVKEMKHVPHIARGTLNIYSEYFALWANYGALSVSLLVNPSRAEQLSGNLFTSGISLRQYCLSRTEQAWNLLISNMNITVEERIALVNHTLENFYNVSIILCLALK